MINRIFKHSKYLLVVPSLLCAYTLYRNHLANQENDRMAFSISLYQSEIRILEQEIREKTNCPTYDDGYKDAILRSCGNWGGDYQAGWRDAYKLLDGRSYSDGYHACLEQFHFNAHGREIVPKHVSEELSNK